MNKEELEQIGDEILGAVKTELLLSMRFLAPALFALDQKVYLATTTIGCDAESILYNPSYIRQTFVEDPSRLNRAYLPIKFDG